MEFTGSIYTWWNGRSDDACIFKRLDRCLGNQSLMNMFPNIEVEDLIKQGSDHTPLLISYKEDGKIVKKPFKFLNFWVEQESLLKVVKQYWSGDFGPDPFFKVHNKMKKVSKALAKWSRDTYGDIFKQVTTLEEVVKVNEIEFEQHPTSGNRERLQKVQAELIKFYVVEEKFRKQKARMQWFKDGDRNTKFFHSHVNGQRKKLQIKKIQDQNGIWLDKEEDIIQEAIRFHTDQFAEVHIPSNFDILNHIPQLVNEDQNKLIHEIPEIEEVKRAVFGLNADSTGGPDGFTEKFYQYC